MIHAMNWMNLQRIIPSEKSILRRFILYGPIYITYLIRQSVFRLDARKMICKMKYQLIGPDQNIKLLLCKNPCEED